MSYSAKLFKMCANQWHNWAWSYGKCMSVKNDIYVVIVQVYL